MNKLNIIKNCGIIKNKYGYFRATLSDLFFVRV